MDFGWMPHFWIFPLLCLLFMVFMMMGCGGMLSRSGHGDRRGNGGETPRQTLERRYVIGEIDKATYDAMRRDLQS